MSILYRNSWLYHTVLIGAYGHRRRERFRAAARWIPDHASVLDVCCGDGRLAEHLPASVRYRGLDGSRDFVRAARRRGRRVEPFDLREDELPSAQIVVCQLALYQFHPDVPGVLARLFAAAEQRLIVTESVRSLAQSRWPWLAELGAQSLRVEGMSDIRFRFTPATLAELFRPFGSGLRHAGAISGGRDWLFVVEK